jgi:hypothetical protein
MTCGQGATDGFGLPNALGAWRNRNGYVESTDRRWASAERPQVQANANKMIRLSSCSLC